jgi:signal transduction histidine kinase
VPKVKFMDKVRTYGMSMKVPLAIIMIAAALIPLFLQAVVMLGSFNQGQLDARTIEIQNQCVILSNKMTRSGYMTAEKKNNTALDSQMQAISDVYNGRIVIVNSNFRVITDTFNLSTGKFYISEEVIKCFKGENSSHYNKDMQYLAQTIPVYDPANEKNIYGVIVVTASTENILSLTDKVMGKSNLFLVFICLAMGVLAVVAVHILMRPFKKLQLSFDRVAQGDLDADITENTYRETTQLSQAVQKSLSKLKAVDQSRQEFVSNVSHELKTPITSIRVLADSLMGMEEVPVELYREFMTDISDEIDRENQIIEDLLTLVKMDKSAESQMNIEQVNINGELELILKRLRPIAKRGNVELVLESIREVTADVDRVKISLAITNLVENAIKYNRDSGNVRVTLDADHKYFYVKVTDTGIGIPEDALEHIFERFFRVDKARSREVGGTGLGLAIAKNVIQMHHGIIDVESTPGEGTSFSMRIPLTYVLRQEVKS